MVFSASGIASLPFTYGQIPARTRSKVLLPLPLGPLIKIFSPRRRLNSAPSIKTCPSGSVISSCLAAMPPSDNSRCKYGCNFSCLTSCMCSPKPVRRLTTDCHSAMEAYISTKYESDSCTLPKALLTCISPPSVIWCAK